VGLWTDPSLSPEQLRASSERDRCGRLLDFLHRNTLFLTTRGLCFSIQFNAMAIATGIPGLEVTIEVDTAALPEYEHGIVEDDGVATSATRYIEAPPAANFSIRYLFRPPFTPPSAVQMDVLLDGNYVQAPFVEWGGKEECEGYLCTRATSSTGGHSFTQGFQFAELRTGKFFCLSIHRNGR